MSRYVRDSGDPHLYVHVVIILSTLIPDESSVPRSPFAQQAMPWRAHTPYTTYSVLGRNVRQRYSLTSSLQLLGNHPAIAVYALWALFRGEDGWIRAGAHLDTGQ